MSPGGMGYLSIVHESGSSIGGMVSAVRSVWMILGFSLCGMCPPPVSGYTDSQLVMTGDARSVREGVRVVS